MSIFGSFADFLQGPVGNNLKNNPRDVRNTKRNLHQAGYFNDEVENDFITRELDQGIRAYQRENNLKQDGILRPLGETELSLFKTLGNRDATAEPGQDSTSLTQTQRETRLAEAIMRKHLSTPDKADAPMQAGVSRAFLPTDNAVKQNIPAVPERKEPELDFIEGLDNQAVRKALKDEEDTILYLYKDTAKGGGKVTVGTGIMLENAEAARKLPFTLPDGKGGRRPATPEEIERGFKKIEAIRNENYIFEVFKPGEGEIAKDHNLDDLQLSEEDIEKLLDKRIRSHVSELRKQFPEFDSFPDGAKHGLLDLHYNLGNTKFNRTNWKNLFKAIDNRDWQRAASESHRKEDGHAGMKDRNKRTYDHFMKAFEGR